jgi:predicted dehydrogenase
MTNEADAAIAAAQRRLRMALVGGAGSGFIGPVHVLAATLDNLAELVAGALSSDPQRARQAAGQFGIDPQRAYGSWADLIAGEAALGTDRRADFVTIATPNYTHFEIARRAVEAGFNVVCDKPLTTDLEQARILVDLVGQRGVVFAVTYGYTGYPMVRQARELVLGGELGEIHAVRVNYIQGGLMGLRPGQTPARAAWKADPAKVGLSGALADIGTHAYHLLGYATGLRPREVSSTLASFHPARPLDDYGHALVRCQNGALAMITVSQISHGRLNDLTLEVDGSRGSLSWRQESPDQLTLRRFGQPALVFERNRRAESMSQSVRAACRLPGGHPEGFYEAFANVYRDAFADMQRRAAGHAFATENSLYPNVQDGLHGVLFVQQCVASSADGGVWQSLADSPSDRPPA